MTTRATRTLAALLIPAAVTSCERGRIEPPEYSLGREIIETFAEYVGEDPSDIRVRAGALDGMRLAGAVDHPRYADIPDVAEAIEKYVQEAGISFPALSEEAPMGCAASDQLLWELGMDRTRHHPLRVWHERDWL